ncbi:hypothetical protein AB0424_27875 [Streptomyces sp. NPDC051180]|uniref:hypothetical protein n=1 Tax=Streptomyces sp. NPDC051180 TaxID=3155797 RepID=UPI00344CC2CD
MSGCEGGECGGGRAQQALRAVRVGGPARPLVPFGQRGGQPEQGGGPLRPVGPALRPVAAGGGDGGLQGGQPRLEVLGAAASFVPDLQDVRQALLEQRVVAVAGRGEGDGLAVDPDGLREVGRVAGPFVT